MHLHIHALALLSFIATAAGVSAQEPTTIPVGTIAAELRPITKTSDFVGRVDAVERVEIRARVTGFLEDVLFKEGDLVKKGDVLYRIEPDSFQAAVQQAQGAVLEAQGKLANASLQRGARKSSSKPMRLTRIAGRARGEREERTGRSRHRGRQPQNREREPRLHRDHRTDHR